MLPLILPPTLIRHHHHHTVDAGSATVYDRHDSNPHLADGTFYGDHGPLFCAAPRSIPLGTVLRLHNPKTGRTIRVVVRDRCRDHIDLSRGAFQRLGGRDGRVPIESKIEHQGTGRSSHSQRKKHRRSR